MPQEWELVRKLRLEGLSLRGVHRVTGISLSWLVEMNKRWGQEVSEDIHTPEPDEKNQTSLILQCVDRTASSSTSRRRVRRDTLAASSTCRASPPSFAWVQIGQTPNRMATTSASSSGGSASVDSNRL